MNILVCIKRVPATAGKITLTADEQAIDTRYLGFTVSPHEECAVEEAVRIVEAHGGSSTVLTLGPEEATDQLREAMAVGIDRAILLQTDGGEWGAVATAAAIVDAIRAREAVDGPFDLILLGNEAADTGDYQVGVRVAVALDRPVVSGAKGLEVRDETVSARREAPGGGWEVYEIPRPAVVTVKEGHQPAALPVGPGSAPRSEEGDRDRRARPGGGRAGSDPPARAGREGECRRDPGRGSGGCAARRRGAAAPRADRMILVVVEHEAGTVDRLSSEALTLGRSLAEATGGPLQAVVWGPGAGAAAAPLGAAGVAAVHEIADPRLTDYAPEALGKALAQLIERDAPAAVIGTGSERGAEVLAHAAARLGVPLAANVTEVRPGEPWQVTRQRWGGSLLEEARLDGPVRLLTVAPHAFAPVSASAAGAPATVQSFAPDLTDRDFRVRITSHVPAEEGAISLADARVVVGGGRGVGSAEGFAQLDELAALLGGTVGVSRVVTSAGWRPHAQQVGQTGTRIAPDLYIACGISGAIQHMVGARSAKAILAINTDRDAPMVTRATYAVIGDLHTVLPAIIAAVRAAR